MIKFFMRERVQRVVAQVLNFLINLFSNNYKNLNL